MLAWPRLRAPAVAGALAALLATRAATAQPSTESERLNAEGKALLQAQPM